MLVGTPFMEAEQDSPIRIEDLPKVVMTRKGNRLTEQRLIPFEAPRDVAYPYDGPRALHRSPLRPNPCLVYRRVAVLLCRQRGLSGYRIVGNSETTKLFGQLEKLPFHLLTKCECHWQTSSPTPAATR